MSRSCRIIFGAGFETFMPLRIARMRIHAPAEKSGPGLQIHRTLNRIGFERYTSHMSWEWITAHWSNLSALVGFVAGLFFPTFSIFNDRRVRKAATHAEFTKAHRDIWIYLRSLPELAHMRDRNRDLASRPRTEIETFAVNVLIGHLAATHKAWKAGTFDMPEGVVVDIQSFFTLPVPREAWLELRTFHPSDLGQFIDDILSRNVNNVSR